MSSWAPRPRPLRCSCGGGENFCTDFLTVCYLYVSCARVSVCVGQVYADVVDYICRSCGRPPFGLVLSSCRSHGFFFFLIFCVLNFPSLTFRFQHFSCEPQPVCAYFAYFPIFFFAWALLAAGAAFKMKYGSLFCGRDKCGSVCLLLRSLLANLLDLLACRIPLCASGSPSRLLSDS